jgi:hypothetical protein
MKPHPLSRLLLLASLIFSAASVARAQYAVPPTPLPNNAKWLSEQSEKALKKSQLTAPGSQPFHIKVSIAETTNPSSPRHAEIEQFWLSPTKFRRTITSPDFSQTLIVNGDNVSENNTGDYYPYWLNEFVTALFDPLPFASSLQQVPTLTAGGYKSSDGTTCGDLHFRVDRWVICFNGDGTFESIFTKSYFAMFRDYHKFGDKRVARRIVTEPENKTEITATITTLEPYPAADESLFTVATPTPAAQRITFLQIGEDTMRKLVIGSPEITWPTVVGGSPTGGCGAFVSADRAGNVREVFPGGCDNAALQQPLADAILKWKLNAPVVKGVPVQVTSLMGFAYNVQVTQPPPVLELSDHDARALASNTVEPNFLSACAPAPKSKLRSRSMMTAPSSALRIRKNSTARCFSRLITRSPNGNSSPTCRTEKRCRSKPPSGSSCRPPTSWALRRLRPPAPAAPAPPCSRTFLCVFGVNSSFRVPHSWRSSLTQRVRF